MVSVSDSDPLLKIFYNYLGKIMKGRIRVQILLLAEYGSESVNKTNTGTGTGTDPNPLKKRIRIQIRK